MAEAAPQIREEAPKASAALMIQRKAIPMQVSATKKKQIRGRSIFAVEELFIDRPIEKDGFNSYAADGREYLDIDSTVVRSLLRTHDRGLDADKKLCAYLMISPAKATICGTDEQVLLVMLNGRQRTKAAEFINRIAGIAYEMWGDMPGGRTDENLVKLKSTLIALAAAGHNAPDGPSKDFAVFYQDGAEENEAINCLVGGRVGGVYQPGFVRLSRETTEGPLPFKIRVEFTDIDPNKPEALLLSVTERINVPTPPLTECHQIAALLESGQTYATIADAYGLSARKIADRLLVLSTIPEVQEAYNNRKVSLAMVVDNFFVSGQRGKLIKAPDEQLRLITRLAGAPVRAKGVQTQADIVAQEKAWPSDFKCEGCGEVVTADVGSRLPNGQILHLASKCKHPDGKGYASGEPLTTTQIVTDKYPGAKNLPPTPATPGASAGANSANGAAPPKTGSPTAGAPAKKRTAATAASGVLAYLPRASTLVFDAAAEIKPDERDGAEMALQKRERRAVLNAVGSVMAFLSGKGDALDTDSFLKETVVGSLGQAQVDADAEVSKKIEEQNTTPEQNNLMALGSLFDAWEALEPDQRGEWPAADEAPPEVRALLGRVQADYAAKVASGDAEFKATFEGNVADFARQWILDNA